MPEAGIGPEIGRDLLGGAETDVEIGRDAGRGEPELRRSRPIYRCEERRGVDLLLKMRVDDPRNRRHAPLQLLRHAQVGRPVVADGPHIDLRRQAEVENLGNDVGRLKVERHFRKGRGQDNAELADIVCGRRMTVFERHQDHAVVDADRGAVGKCEVVGARGQPDVVDDQSAVALRE